MACSSPKLLGGDFPAEGCSWSPFDFCCHIVQARFGLGQRLQSHAKRKDLNLASKSLQLARLLSDRFTSSMAKLAPEFESDLLNALQQTRQTSAV